MAKGEGLSYPSLLPQDFYSDLINFPTASTLMPGAGFAPAWETFNLRDYAKLFLDYAHSKNLLSMSGISLRLELQAQQYYSDDLQNNNEEVKTQFHSWFTRSRQKPPSTCQ